MKSAVDYANELAQIADLNDITGMERLNGGVSANYASKCVAYGEYEVRRSMFMDETEKKLTEAGEKKPSQAWLKTQWETCKVGQEMTRTKYELEAMKGLVAGVKNHIVLMSYDKQTNRNE